MDSSSTYRVIISKRAREDYWEIIDGIANITLFERSVNKWAVLLGERIRSLEFMPKRYGVYELDGEFRSTHVGKYRIIYYVDDDKKNCKCCENHIRKKRSSQS